MTAICEFLNEFESDEEDAARKDEPSTSGSTPSAAAADEFTVFDVDALQQRFEVDGLSVWEDACSEAYAEAVREEVTLLQEAMMMEPSRNRLTAARDPTSGQVTRAHTMRKLGVHELDIVVGGEVVSPAALDLCPAIAAFAARHGPALAERLNAACPALGLTGIDTIKAQLNEGVGGGFPMHYDSAATHSRRAVTALLYLEPAWDATHGGELVVCPFPAPPRAVAPRGRTLALFCSTETLHLVRPARAPRRCLSVWFASADSAALPLYPLPSVTPSRASTAADAGDDDGADSAESGAAMRRQQQLAALLADRRSRRALAKVAYRGAYAESFADAFGRAAPGLDEVRTQNAWSWAVIKSRVDRENMAHLRHSFLTADLCGALAPCRRLL